MIRQFYLCFVLVFSAFIMGCDDGDVLTVDLDFSQELERCENFEDFHLIYDTRDDPSEALILVFNKNNANDQFFLNPTTVNEPVILNIDQNNVRFIYRTYNRNLNSTELCEILPPGTLNILDDYEADSGEVTVSVTILDDDNDGIPTEFEGLAGEPDEFGRYMDSTDTDLDGLPDYLDSDDDNDNVPTRLEIDNSDEDNNPFTNPMNTDFGLTNGDNLPDHLDPDDDGDDIPTRLEDVNGDQDPRGVEDEVVNTEGDDIFRYLYNHPIAEEGFPDSGKKVTLYNRVVTTRFTITGIDLEILRSTFVDFGTLIGPSLQILPEIFIEDDED
ncbi:MAG: hypothetical protein AB8B52_05330 [Winogradskyella sp.]|uniref:hypothetical protein n=1 Tax=Winogradskyella sp. TaxID=1883156 RepID=UPI003858850F